MKADLRSTRAVLALLLCTPGYSILGGCQGPTSQEESTIASQTSVSTSEEEKIVTLAPGLLEANEAAQSDPSIFTASEAELEIVPSLVLPAVTRWQSYMFIEDEPVREMVEQAQVFEVCAPMLAYTADIDSGEISLHEGLVYYPILADGEFVALAQFSDSEPNYDVTGAPQHETSDAAREAGYFSGPVMYTAFTAPGFLEHLKKGCAIVYTDKGEYVVSPDSISVVKQFRHDGTYGRDLYSGENVPSAQEVFELVKDKIQYSVSDYDVP